MSLRSELLSERDAQFLPARPPASGRRNDGRSALRAVPGWWLTAKRLTDVAISGVLLVVCLPVFVLAAAAIRIASPGPALFMQTRVGKSGRHFRLLKFRTMFDGAHLLHHHVAHLNECDGPALKIVDDPRMHSLGAFLRRASIDELPQLWNVLRGDMSLVGPRPALPHEVATYERCYLRRLRVMPGITGLWQVSGRASVPFQRWMAMDLWYVRHWSPLVDLWLLLRTIPAVLRRDGAW